MSLYVCVCGRVCISIYVYASFWLCMSPYVWVCVLFFRYSGACTFVYLVCRVCECTSAFMRSSVRECMSHVWVCEWVFIIFECVFFPRMRIYVHASDCVYVYMRECLSSCLRVCVCIDVRLHGSMFVRVYFQFAFFMWIDLIACVYAYAHAHVDIYVVVVVCIFVCIFVQLSMYFCTCACSAIDIGVPQFFAASVCTCMHMQLCTCTLVYAGALCLLVFSFTYVCAHVWPSICNDLICFMGVQRTLVSIIVCVRVI